MSAHGGLDLTGSVVLCPCDSNTGDVPGPDWIASNWVGQNSLFWVKHEELIVVLRVANKLPERLRVVIVYTLGVFVLDFVHNHLFWWKIESYGVDVVVVEVYGLDFRKGVYFGLKSP